MSARIVLAAVSLSLLALLTPQQKLTR